MDILKNNRFLIFLFVFLCLCISVYLLIQRVTKTHSVVNSDLVESIDKQNRLEVEKLKKETLELRKEVFSKIKNDSILFDSKTREINDLKAQLKYLKIENEKKHIVNSNTTTGESSLILRDNIKKRITKGN